MATRAIITNDRQILALRPTDRSVEIGVGDARGLTLRLLPSGLKSFEFRYVAIAGRRRRMVLGTYPALSLSEARRKALAL